MLRQSTYDTSRYLRGLLWVVTVVVAGATMAGLSKEAELLGAMHIGRLLMRLGCRSRWRFLEECEVCMTETGDHIFHILEYRSSLNNVFTN